MKLPEHCQSFCDLQASFEQIKPQFAWQAITEFLVNEKEKAMFILRIKDDATARATWQFVDRVYDRLDMIRKEAQREIDESIKKNK